MNAPKAVASNAICNRSQRSHEFILGALLTVLAGMGCGSSRLEADAHEYVRIESQVAESMSKADQLQAKGDQKGYLAETLNGGGISMGMDKIRNKYKSVSEARDAEFMQAVEKAKAAKR